LWHGPQQVGTVLLGGRQQAAGQEHLCGETIAHNPLHLTEELIDVTLAGANGSQVYDLGTVILSHIGNRD
jgi:hypothetical protein